MQQAEFQRRQGNVTGARQLALKAGRFPVAWSENELSPSQFLKELSGTSGSLKTLNPESARSQLIPRRTAPPRVSPVDAVGTQRRPFDPAGHSQRDADLQPVFADSLRPIGEPAISMTEREPPFLVETDTTTSPASGRLRSQRTQQSQPSSQQARHPFTQSMVRSTRADGVTAPSSVNSERIQGRIDDYMQQAYEAWEREDTPSAIRYASVADVLSGGRSAAGVESPAAFLARIRSGKNPTQAGRVQTSIVDVEENSESSTLSDSNAGIGFSQVSNPPVVTPEPDFGQRFRESGEARRRRAKELILAARTDIEMNRLHAAYGKVMMAQGLDVTWDRFEETPEKLAADILNLIDASERLAAGSDSTETTPAKNLAIPDDDKTRDSATITRSDLHPARQTIEETRDPESARRGVNRVEIDAGPESTQARFLDRIHAMLAEARSLESAGRPGEAMVIAVRASRMLDVIGAESVWPADETSPASYLASLAAKHNPSVLNSADVLPASLRSQADSNEAAPVAAEDPFAELEADKWPSAKAATDNPVSRTPTVVEAANPAQAAVASPGIRIPFPDIPERRRSWIPVGEPTVGKRHGWIPAGDSQEASVLDSGSQLPSAAEKASHVGGISDTRVMPIPVEILPPDRVQVAPIDIRLNDGLDNEPDAQLNSTGDTHDAANTFGRSMKLPAATQAMSTDIPPAPLHVEALADQVETVSPGTESPTEFRGEASRSGADVISTTTDKEKDSRLFVATLVGALSGVLILLVGGPLLRRFGGRFHSFVMGLRTRKSPAGLAETAGSLSSGQNGGLQSRDATVTRSARGLIPDLNQGEHESDSEAGSVAPEWNPGSSWLGSKASPVKTTSTQEVLANEVTTHRLQVFREDSESGTAPTEQVHQNRGVEENPKTVEVAPSVVPAVPFRVFGTEVVLGESESARVDEELHRRRERILKHVLDENLNIQQRLRGSEEESKEAA